MGLGKQYALVSGFFFTFLWLLAILGYELHQTQGVEEVGIESGGSFNTCV